MEPGPGIDRLALELDAFFGETIRHFGSFDSGRSQTLSTLRTGGDL
jgi:hypothetical protein